MTHLYVVEFARAMRFVHVRHPVVSKPVSKQSRVVKAENINVSSARKKT